MTGITTSVSAALKWHHCQKSKMSDIQNVHGMLDRIGLHEGMVHFTHDMHIKQIYNTKSAIRTTYHS